MIYIICVYTHHSPYSCHMYKVFDKTFQSANFYIPKFLIFMFLLYILLSDICPDMFFTEMSFLGVHKFSITSQMFFIPFCHYHLTVLNAIYFVSSLKNFYFILYEFIVYITIAKAFTWLLIFNWEQVLL